MNQYQNHKKLQQVNYFTKYSILINLETKEQKAAPRSIILKRYGKKLPKQVEIPATMDDLLALARTLFRDPNLIEIWKFDPPDTEIPICVSVISLLEDGKTYFCASQEDLDKIENEMQ
jgi:hypothetical protein